MLGPLGYSRCRSVGGSGDSVCKGFHQEFLQRYVGVLLAFGGGVHSTCLLVSQVQLRQ